MYKKISDGYFVIPDYISTEAAAVIKSCLIVDPQFRVKSDELKKMSWLTSNNIARYYRGYFAGKENEEIDEKIIKNMEQYGFQPEPTILKVEAGIFCNEFLMLKSQY